MPYLLCRLTGFWEDKFKIEGDSWGATYRWVTGIIGELIQEGTKDDAWAFSETHFNDAKKIIFLILENQRVQEGEEVQDYVVSALNSSFGKVLTALIYLELRIACVEDKKGGKKEIKWSVDVKEKYGEALEKDIVESYALLGRYIEHFYYLDKKWVEDKIQTILFLEKKHLWEAFMSGYLLGGGVYKNLYKLMREHYLSAIEYEYVFKEKNVEERLVQHNPAKIMMNLVYFVTG